MKRHRILQILALAGLLSFGATSFAALDVAGLLSDIEQVSGLDLDAERDRLLAGELVTGRYEVEKGQIAAAQLKYLPVQVADIVALVSDGRFHSQAKQVQALESADTPVTIVSLDDKQARKLAKAEPGDDFNFSAAEFEQLEQGSDDVAGTLNAILSARHAAYGQSGLKRIADYQRNEKESVNSADFLEETAKAAKAWPKHFPGLFQSALDYPKTGPSIDNKLFAVALDVEGEPQFVLSHWMIDKDSGDYVALIQRQYYQTFTPKVAGFGSGMAHNIGRKRLAEAIADTFNLVQAAVQ
ncbi:MAG: hypothetical protein P8Y95_18675 [Gammaproteobacteria bacterium]